MSLVIVDILSDLHVDFYFRTNPTEKSVESSYSHIFTDNQKRKVGDMLIVAGDIGHNNEENIKVLELIKQIFEYKYIVCVLGNHDFYLLNHSARSDYDSNSLLRAEEMRKYIKKQDGMYCLDGDIIEIEGIRIGGCDSWYDGEYIKKHFGKDGQIRPLRSSPINEAYIHQLWNQTMNDSYYIYNMDWQEYAQLEKEHTSSSYREEESTGFFTFNGSKYLKNGSMKYWIFGHTHVETEFEIDGVKCICNPMGYPGESSNGEWTRIKSIEI